MSTKKLFSLFAVLAGLLAVLMLPGISAADRNESLSGAANRETRAWYEPPANAKDVRTLIYRASRAGKRQESMTLGTAVMSRAGITLRGDSCRRGAIWLNFSEQARTHVVGGKLCDGGMSFERRPNYRQQRYVSLLDHVSSKVLAGLRVDSQKVGWPLLIRSDGKRALVLFDRSGGKGKHPIRAIRFEGSERTVERF